MRRLGGATLTFVTITEDLDDKDRYGNPSVVRTEVDVPGCRFRPLAATEALGEGNEVVKDQWKATCPPLPTVLAATSRDEVKVDGVTLQIVGGPRVFPDKSGAPWKVTVICERLAG